MCLSFEGLCVCMQGGRVSLSFERETGGVTSGHVRGIGEEGGGACPPRAEGTWSIRIFIFVCCSYLCGYYTSP